jgi:hypothetical protein
MLDFDPYRDCADFLRGLGLAFAALVGGVVLIACSDSRPVTYYLSHPQERGQRVDDCLAHAADTQDCRNAKQADFQSRGIPAKDGAAL